MKDNNLKFDIGSWIINGNKQVYYVKSAFENHYELVSINGFEYTVHVKDIEPYYHLWTITDANTGDILASEHSIFIFKEESLARKPIAYCGLIDNMFFKGVDYCWTNEKFHPATKQQIKLLFETMLKHIN